MLIGVPKEIKNNEYRVAITPAGVKSLIDGGHKVIIEKGAGLGSAIPDEDYISVGAEIIAEAKDIFGKSDIIIKVKEPLKEEYDYLRPGQILFTYLHLAANKPLTEALVKKKVIAIAYETIQLEDGSLPLLTPMSEVAGRLSIQAGAHFLEKPQGGSGVLLGGVPGVRPGKVVIVGGGVVGLNAARMALGLGAEVVVMEISASRMAYLDDLFQGRLKTLMSNQYNLSRETKDADLVVGAVLIPGAKAPKLITEDMIKEMKPGSVIVDVAIDQGGCVENTYPTTHDNPIFVKYDVIHYSVANMPGAVAHTSTYALTNVTLPYILQIANQGYKKALKENRALLLGLNTYEGKVTCQAVAEAVDMEYWPLEEAIKTFSAD